MRENLKNKIYLFGIPNLSSKKHLKPEPSLNLNSHAILLRLVFPPGKWRNCSRVGAASMGCFQVLSHTDRDLLCSLFLPGFLCYWPNFCLCNVWKSLKYHHKLHPSNKRAVGDGDTGRAERPWHRSVGLLLMCQISQIKRLCLSSVILIY